MRRRKRGIGIGPIILGLIFMCGFWYLLNDAGLVGYSTNVPLAIGSNNPTLEFNLSRDVTYNYTEIENEVIEGVRNYFYCDNYTEFTINYFNDSVWKSAYGGAHNGTTLVRSEIYIGMIDIKDNPEMFRMVFTHEYIHYIISKYDFNTSNERHEALSEVYTWYSNEVVMKNQWGNDDSGREYPYDIIMKEVLAKDYSCLNKVFVVKDYIKNGTDYLDRINRNCNLNITV